MRLMVFLLIQYLSVFVVHAQIAKQLRNSFTMAAKDKSFMNEFKQNMLHFDAKEEVALWKGYQSVWCFLQCRYIFNPYEKWQQFLKGKNLMEAAINSDSLNVELRWLRYAIQSQLPFFLNYHQHEKEDRAILMHYVKAGNNADKDLIQRVQQLMQPTTK